MWKSLTVTVLLLVLGAGVLCGAYVQVNQAQDAVEIQENIVYGDRSALDGLTVDCTTYTQKHLLWDTRCTFTDGFSAETEFTFQQSSIQWSRILTGGLGAFYLNLPNDSFGVSGDFELYDSYSALSEFMRKPVEDVASRTPDNQTVSEQLRVRDYYEFYPVGFTFPSVTGYGLQGEAEEEHAWKYFEAYFQIPVQEDHMIEVSVSRNAEGRILYSQTQWLQGGVNLNMFSVITEDACWFTVDCIARDTGERVEIHTPDGYGIYRFPLHEGTLMLIEVEQLELAYPLDFHKSEILDLRLTDDESQMLLITNEDGKVMLTVIDPASMETLQRVELFDGKEEQVDVYDEDGMLAYSYTAYCGYSRMEIRPDYLVAVAMDGSFVLLAEDGTGQYEERIRSSLCEIKEWGDILYTYSRRYYNRGDDDLVMDYDGERLAVAAFRGWFDCSFYLAVYDETGLLYAGEYLHSQDTGVKSGNIDSFCVPAEIQPLRLSWE